ncbi:hypothetical protein [Zymobacter sp. IVIA_12111.31 C1]|uniref:hypothetical protein n=1 Tax=Zymobacter sp. IVIA_12111.31 C1 TaxID=3394854 RepID=UPI0039C2C23D
MSNLINKVRDIIAQNDSPVMVMPNRQRVPLWDVLNAGMSGVIMCWALRLLWAIAGIWWHTSWSIGMPSGLRGFIHSSANAGLIIAVVLMVFALWAVIFRSSSAWRWAYFAVGFILCCLMAKIALALCVVIVIARILLFVQQRNSVPRVDG